MSQFLSVDEILMSWFSKPELGEFQSDRFCEAASTPCLKKWTTYLWLAITLTHMNGFWFFWHKCYW